MSSVDDYLETLDGPAQAAYRRLCSVVRSEVPDAEEGTSYGVPAFRYGGSPLLGLKAAAGHLSVFPFSPAVVEAVRPALEGFALSKGTIRFTPEQPLPDDVVRELVRRRVAEITAAG